LVSVHAKIMPSFVQCAASAGVGELAGDAGYDFRFVPRGETD
jgi:hypothetical protein